MADIRQVDFGTSDKEAERKAKVEALLEEAAALGFDKVVIAGYEDGQLHMRSANMTYSDVVYTVEVVKHTVLNTATK